MTIIDRLGAAGPPGQIGLGLAAIGRPGYITVGRANDLPADRSVPALLERTIDLLDRAYARGVRYIDVARSYGRAEEFLAHWLDIRGVSEAIIGSKWGYTYTAGWRVDAEVHEVKDHSLATLDRQLAETRSLIGDRLALYQIHSLTPDSPALTDRPLHRRLAELAATGVAIGVSTSGPNQSDAIRAALAVTVDGEPLFRSVQATWNLLEPTAGPALADAHDAGCLVIIKEALANGRLARPTDPHTAKVIGSVADELAVTPDAIALAAALRQPWATVVLSGAVTVDQIETNLNAADVQLRPKDLRRLDRLAEPAAAYWRRRATQPWS